MDPSGNATEKPSNVPSLPVPAPLPMVPPDYLNGAWPDDMSSSGRGIRTYLHALRRRWLIAAALGLVFSAAAATAIRFGHVPQYSAQAFLRVRASEPQFFFPALGQGSETSFEIYKSNQIQQMKNEFVLDRAISKPEIASLPMVKEQVDELRWLSEGLRVDFPGDGEFMRVSLRGEDPKGLAKVINAVIDVYMQEVVDREASDREERLAQLQKVCDEKEDDLRKKWNELGTLAQDLGVADPSTLSPEQRLGFHLLEEYRSELIQVRLEKDRLISGLSAMRQAAEILGIGRPPGTAGGKEQAAEVETDAGAGKPAIGTKPEDQATPQSEAQIADLIQVKPEELDAVAQSDPATLELMARRDALQMQSAAAEERLQAPLVGQRIEKYRQQIGEIDKQLASRREELRGGLQRQKLGAIDGQIAQFESQIAAIQRRDADITREIEELQKTVPSVGGSSVDVDMLRAEINRMEAVYNPLAVERERLRIELPSRDSEQTPEDEQARQRIYVDQYARDPRTPDNDNLLGSLVFAALVAFALPVGGIVFWDVRAQRINSSEEVSDGTGLEVLGAVPIIPVRAIQHAGSGSRKHQRWRALFAEAVDGIAARLLREAKERGLRVLLVSSATSGEGKTTLSSQLALSLARTGHRTVLVDFDLRRPALDGAFGLPLEPGVGNWLQETAGLEDILQETNVENLTVVTSGSWQSQSLRMLSGKRIEQFFGELRKQCEFVVVDASPILPVADSRIVSQHVDAVILSVLRDVSRIPKVLAARRILAGFGVAAVSAIVIGSSEEVYYKDLGYQDRASA